MQHGKLSSVTRARKFSLSLHTMTMYSSAWGPILKSTDGSHTSSRVRRRTPISPMESTPSRHVPSFHEKLFPTSPSSPLPSFATPRITTMNHPSHRDQPRTPHTTHIKQGEEDDIEAQLEAARRLNEELRRMELGESGGLLYEDIYGEGGGDHAPPLAWMPNVKKRRRSSSLHFHVFIHLRWWLTLSNPPSSHATSQYIATTLVSLYYF